MSAILDTLSWLFLLIGGFLGVTGALGLFRFPDFFTRLHAASVTDTLCAGMIVLGLMLQATDAMMVVKLLLILLILTYTSPTAAHVLAKSAIHGGLQPYTGSNGPESTAGQDEQPEGESPSIP